MNKKSQRLCYQEEINKLKNEIRKELAAILKDPEIPERVKAPLRRLEERQ